VRSDDNLTAALARVRALGPGTRGTLTGGWVPSAPPTAHEAWLEDGPSLGDAGPPGDEPTRNASDDAEDVVARLRARALAVASIGYSAAHGHPLDHQALDPGSRRWRWLLSRRGAVAVGLIVALLAIVVIARTSGRMPTTALSVRDPSGSLIDAALGGSDAGHATPGNGAATSTQAAGTAVTVHVVGQVRAPGVVRLQPGSRIADAIAAAGGPTKQADLAAVNLARLAVDGEQVYLPAGGEPARAAPAGPGLPGSTASGVIDLNSADVATLDTLPGIGSVLAGRIVDWRKQHGRFTAVDELGEVDGIGPTLLGKLRDRVKV